MLPIILSFGAVYALIPLLIIIILIAAAAGISRGYDIFAIFGIGVLAGIGGKSGGKGSLAGKSAYKGRAGSTIGRAFAGSPVGRKISGQVAARAAAAKGAIVTGRSAKALNSALVQEVVAKSGPVTSHHIVKMAVGGVAATGALMAGAGVRAIASGTYGRTLKKYEGAKTQADREKYASKLQDLREQHGIKPTTNIELASAKDAINYDVKKAGSLGRTLTKKETDTLTKRLTDLTRIQALHEEAQKLKVTSGMIALGGALPAGYIENEVGRLVNEFHGKSTPASRSALDQSSVENKVKALTAGLPLYSAPPSVKTMSVPGGKLTRAYNAPYNAITDQTSANAKKMRSIMNFFVKKK